MAICMTWDAPNTATTASTRRCHCLARRSLGGGGVQGRQPATIAAGSINGITVAASRARKNSATTGDAARWRFSKDCRTASHAAIVTTNAAAAEGANTAANIDDANAASVIAIVTAVDAVIL